LLSIPATCVRILTKLCKITDVALINTVKFQIKKVGESTKMPYINIKITRESVTKDQKQQLIAGATQLLADVLGKNPATTFVIIEEVDTDNWGIGGAQVSERRKQGL
jgi:4-oxalocrotonate tautomerase